MISFPSDLLLLPYFLSLLAASQVPVPLESHLPGQSPALPCCWHSPALPKSLPHRLVGTPLPPWLSQPGCQTQASGSVSPHCRSDPGPTHLKIPLAFRRVLARQPALKDLQNLFLTSLSSLACPCSTTPVDLLFVPQPMQLSLCVGVSSYCAYFTLPRLHLLKPYSSHLLLLP